MALLTPKLKPAIKRIEAVMRDKRKAEDEYERQMSRVQDRRDKAVAAATAVLSDPETWNTIDDETLLKGLMFGTLVLTNHKVFEFIGEPMADIETLKGLLSGLAQKGVKLCKHATMESDSAGDAADGSALLFYIEWYVEEFGEPLSIEVATMSGLTRLVARFKCITQSAITEALRHDTSDEEHSDEYFDLTI